MTRHVVALGIAAALVGLTGCGSEGEVAGNETAARADGNGVAAGNQTIAAGVAGNGRFAGALKAAGLEPTLSGAEPYTVLVPTDQAFEKLPAGTYDNWTKPENKAQLTGVLRYHILPGTVLAEDIGKAIENADGRAMLATMGGEPLTATREGGNIVLADGSGNRATVSQADRRYTNGVVHMIDAVLVPEELSGGQQPESGS
jgi:uncharacterized surface protein with fasciclin (FAS1) repeats